MKGIRCSRCGKWWGRHRLELVGDGRTNNVCALNAAIEAADSQSNLNDESA